MIGTIVFPAYNRPEFLARTIASWTRVRWLGDWAVQAFIEPSPAARESQLLFRQFGIRERSHEISGLGRAMRVNGRRLGLTRNLHQAWDTGFRSTYFVVCAEDDIIVSSDILEYFEWASKEFKDNPEVLGVCSHSTIPSDDPSAVALLSSFSPWVWGTWRDRWQAVFSPTWDFAYTTGRPDQNNGQAGVGPNIALRVIQDRKFVFPLHSRSNHIGHYGTHMTSEINTKLDKPFRFALERPPCDYHLVSA